MFCNKCGMQVADGAPYCPNCGNRMGVADSSTPPAYPEPVVVYPPPKRGKLGFVMMGLSVLAATAVAVATLVLTGPQAEPTATPESVATAYALAEYETDSAKLLELMAGDARSFNEDMYAYIQDVKFSRAEQLCEDVGLDCTVDDWDGYYSAYKEYTKVELAEQYGEDYAISTEILYTEDMDDEVLDAYRTLLTDDVCLDYINPDLITDGKYMAMELYIEGSYDYDYSYTLVAVLEYDGKWTATNPFLYPYTEHEDYDVDSDKEDAADVIYDAILAVESNAEDNSDYSAN